MTVKNNLKKITSLVLASGILVGSIKFISRDALADAIHEENIGKLISLPEYSNVSKNSLQNENTQENKTKISQNKSEMQLTKTTTNFEQDGRIVWLSTDYKPAYPDANPYLYNNNWTKFDDWTDSSDWSRDVDNPMKKYSTDVKDISGEWHSTQDHLTAFKNTTLNLKFAVLYNNAEETAGDNTDHDRHNKLRFSLRKLSPYDYNMMAGYTIPGLYNYDTSIHDWNPGNPNAAVYGWRNAGNNYDGAEIFSASNDDQQPTYLGGGYHTGQFNTWSNHEDWTTRNMSDSWPIDYIIRGLGFGQNYTGKNIVPGGFSDITYRTEYKYIDIYEYNIPLTECVACNYIVHAFDADDSGHVAFSYPLFVNTVSLEPITSNIETIINDTQNMSSQIGGIETNTQNINTEISDLKGEVNIFKTEMDTVKTEIEIIDEKIEKVLDMLHDNKHECRHHKESDKKIQVNFLP